jgi:hypothetical protein
MAYEAVCKMGAVCAEEELHKILKRRNVKGYKVIALDDEAVANWEDKDWIYV